MGLEKPAPWTGASGAEYIFHVFGPDPDVPARLGNYIYAKRNDEGAWVPIYMGHGDLATLCADAALLRCIASKNPTHVHLRLNSLEPDRESELQDLLAHYANAFAPEGCHPKQGGATDEPAQPQTPAKKPAIKKAAVKKTPAKKAPAKKAPAKKTAAKKAAVKTASKSPRPRSK